MIGGSCDGRFAEVRAEFERSFAERGEVGAGVCVLVDGEPVVDLYGGIADTGSGSGWTADTGVVVWSSTKGATALCAHLLVDRGQLDLDAPVASYWPEFGAAGKQAVSTRMLLSHQAGLPALREPLPDGAFTDWGLMVERLAAEAPFWVPGTRTGYHALTYGWLVGEVIRRISGRTPGRFFADEVAGPLGLEFWIGLPDGHPAPVARLLAPDPGAAPTSFMLAAMTDPTSIAALILGNNGGYMMDSDQPRYHAAEIPAAGGIATARGLAGMYRPLAAGGGSLLSAETLAGAIQVYGATAVDASLLTPVRFALGFTRSVGVVGPGDTLVLGGGAFGHSGSGGSIGFADPDAGLAFGYVMNQMGSGIGLNARGQSLVDATYRALGYRTDKPGVWIR
jgi:CubicO group peptidase (beta-lactamase class C family)